jgi:cation diffusion facilitator CzcD-associated flavoprotein CzcO
MFDLPTFPQRLLVVGGGYIACEFASIFNGLGAQVTQLYRGEQVLRGFDDEIRHFVAAEMGKHGVDLRLNSDVVEIHRSASGLQVRLTHGGTLEVDAVLYATGRKPLVHGLGLEALGVAQGAQGATDAQLLVLAGLTMADKVYDLEGETETLRGDDAYDCDVCSKRAADAAVKASSAKEAKAAGKTDKAHGAGAHGGAKGERELAQPPSPRPKQPGLKWLQVNGLPRVL